MATLTFLKGAKEGTTIPLEGERIVLGRQETCTVVLNVPAVSREHAVIRVMQGKFFIEDLKSRNGTYVNNKEVTGRVELRDNDRIKICDNLMAFQAAPRKPALPVDMRKGTDLAVEEEEESSTVEASIAHSSILDVQPSERLAFLINMLADLTQTLGMEELLGKIMDRLFHVFRQADRGFVILAEDDKLIPKVIKTRRGLDEAGARFSRKIVNRCLETGEALLSEDASADQRFDLSQSIAECRIRSVMCAPLMGRTTGKGIGVVQLDTQDRLKKFNQEDLRLLIGVAGQAAVALENARLHENLLTRAGLERDLRLAHQVQMSFLPKKFPQLPGYEFFAHYESAQEVGGDYYDFIPLPASASPGAESGRAGRLGILIGDVAGKGIPAALLMAKVSSDARLALLTEAGAADAVCRLNDLMQEAGLLDRFVTLEACLLDPLAHRVTLVNAGHPPAMRFRKATGQLEPAVARELAGFPLGVVEGAAYESIPLALEPGDALVMFTDGITDAKNKDETEFQMSGVLTALKAGPMTPKAMGDRLVAACKKHFAGCKQHDDLTVVCFGRLFA